MEVLLLHRHLAHADVVAALAAVVPVGATTADVVAVEARKIAAPHTAIPLDSDGEVGTLSVRRVVSLTERRLADPAAVIAGLPADERPVPSVHAYDELLARRTPPTDPLTASTGEVS